MLKIGALVSGGGTNLQAIIDAVEQGEIPEAQVVTVVSSSPKAYALERAEKHGINSRVLRKKDFATIDEYEQAMIEHFQSFSVDLIVLAGFLVVLGEKFVNAFPNKIMNIHPALISGHHQISS